MAAEKHARKAHRESAASIPVTTELPPRPVPAGLAPPVSPAIPQGPSNSAANHTGPASPMGTIEIATGPNPDGLRHQGLVAAQGQPGMDTLTTQSIRDSRAPAPKEQ